MSQHVRISLLAVLTALSLAPGPVLADPEWIECTIDEVTVMASHIEVSCSGLYAPTAPPSQAARAGAAVGGLQAMRVDPMGKAPAAIGKASPSSTASRGGKRVTSDTQGKAAPPQSKTAAMVGIGVARPQAVIVETATPLSPDKNAIRVYAVPYSAPSAQAMLQLLIAAQQGDFILQLKTDYADISAVALGCPERDCRLLQEARLFRADN